MNSLLLLARLALTSIFAVAGVAKLADPIGTRQALRAFGAPQAVATPLGILLPVFELAIAAALIPAASAWWAGASALFLLLVFILAISINLARGRRPNCHCFGQLYSAPAGWLTLVRNAMFACFAALIVWSGQSNPDRSVLGWFGDLMVTQRVGLAGGLVGLALLAAEGLLLFQILRQQGRILIRLDTFESLIACGKSASSTKASTAPVVGLPLGARAPRFPLKGLRGEAVTIEAFLAERKPLLLLFTNPDCGPCQALMPEVGRWQHEHSTSLTILLVSEGSAEDNRAKNTAQVSHLLLQQKREMAVAYQAWGTPAGVLVRPDGTVGSPVAQGAEAIRALVAGTVGGLPGGQLTRTGTKIGTPAPSLELVDLNGQTVPLAGFQGRETLILFWNPGCGFCQQMLSDLKEWDASPPPGAPDLLVVSIGTAEENRAMKLRSTILLDQSFQAGAAFGATGTPMAILVDADGRIASEVAAGAQAVFRLAGSAVEQTVAKS